MLLLRRLAAVTTATTVAVLLLPVVPATAAERPGAGNLSPRLAKLTRPSVRLAPPSVQADELGLVAAGPGSLLRRGNRVLVYVQFDSGAVAGLPAIRHAGAAAVVASRRYQTVTAAVRPDELKALADVPRVASVTEALAPVLAEACPSGEVVSAGVGQMKAGEGTGEARDALGVDGSGVTVGILSDSFDQATEAIGGGAVKTHALEDEETGDLPGPDSPCANKEEVDVLQPFEPEFEGEETFDEGRAMAQIVHDVAPEASIQFASAFNGEASFAANIEALAEEGADVIADDVFYLGETFFQEGPIAVAATKAVEGGVAYLSAAGNDNLLDADGNDIASWEAPAYRDAGGCPREVAALSFFKTSHCLDFDPGEAVDRTFGIRVKPHRDLIVDLQWDEPWFGVKTDLDAFLLDSEGRLLEAEFNDNVHETKRPAEILEWENESSATQTVQLVVNRFSGGSPTLKFALLENGSGVAATEYPRSSETDTVGPTIFGHSAAAGTVSVGAIDVAGGSEPEQYSSRGPARHDFGPVTSTKAAAPLPEPEILYKPDVIAGDCGATTFFARLSAGVWRFCGTSAAAPHAAGVAALMRDAKPGTSAADVHTALQEGAAPVGSPPFGACAVGAGLVDAVGAIEALPVTGGYSPPECLGPSARVSDGEARAAGDWGAEAPPSPPTAITAAPTAGDEAQALVRPRTFIRAHPRHLVRTRRRTARVVFRFGSDQDGVHFVCRIDDGLFRPCPERLVRGFGIGWHMLRVAARNADGVGDRTPALYRFRVKRIR